MNKAHIRILVGVRHAVALARRDIERLVDIVLWGFAVAVAQLSSHELLEN